MAGGSLPEAALTAGSRIGRYFGLVSALPSVLFVLFIYGLLTGAWNGPPDMDAAGEALTGLGLGGVGLLLLLSVTLGVITHPLQFALIQVLEGYWGINRVARRVAAGGVRHHRA